MRKYFYLLPVAAAFAAVLCHGSDLKLQRLKLNSLPAMRAVLADAGADPVLRRTAFRNILRTDAAAAAAEKHLHDRDAELRKAAAFYLFHHMTPRGGKELCKALRDSEFQVRYLAVLALKQSPSPEIQAILKEFAASMDDPRIRKAINAPAKSPARQNRLLKDDPFWDFDIVKTAEFELSGDAVRFQPDAIADGQSKGYQEADFDDSAWKNIAFGAWQEHGFKAYRGTAWYRMKFVMPRKPDCNAVELLLPEVRGDAWIWLNGVFIGSHEVNSAGNETVRLDITNETAWGRNNQLSIRISSGGAAGGILKPVKIEIFK